MPYEAAESVSKLFKSQPGVTRTSTTVQGVRFTAGSGVKGAVVWRSSRPLMPLLRRTESRCGTKRRVRGGALFHSSKGAEDGQIHLPLAAFTDVNAEYGEIAKSLDSRMLTFVYVRLRTCTLSHCEARQRIALIVLHLLQEVG